jgi:large conductance mechanosensitive channel
MWAERPLHGVGNEVGGFRKFILRGNVVDLAVGVVIGAAFGNLVQAFVKDFLNPLIGMAGGTPNLADLTFQVGQSQFLVGDFLNALLSFLLIALVTYFAVVVPVNRLRDRFEPKPEPAPTKECPECLSKVPERARRCAYCTSPLGADSPRDVPQHLPQQPPPRRSMA